jgi:putative ATPase
MVIANLTKSHFETLSAVLAGKADLREVIDGAIERRKLYRKRTI